MVVLDNSGAPDATKATALLCAVALSGLQAFDLFGGCHRRRRCLAGRLQAIERVVGQNGSAAAAAWPRA